MQTTVIYHSADADGWFCREIAHKFLPDATLIGWDYGDPLLNFPSSGQVYVLDLSPDCFDPGMGFHSGDERLIWIDHHKTAIGKWPSSIRGVRIDGVAACRLAWQWFANESGRGDESEGRPFSKEDYVERRVTEPYAVRLAGEYDIWDKRDPNAELFQHGLRTRDLDTAKWGDSSYWSVMCSQEIEAKALVNDLLISGKYLEYARRQEYREVILEQGFNLQFEGLQYLACNSHELDIRSQLFEAGLKPEHDGCLGFTFTGKDWRVSLYGVPGKDIDHSAVAVKYGGGGHRGACGFRTKTLPWIT